jgi:hypothetical protein
LESLDWQGRTVSNMPFVRYSYNSNNQFEEDEICGASSTNGEKRNAYRLLVGKPEGRRPPGRPRHS